jgi:hypothetical protein
MAIIEANAGLAQWGFTRDAEIQPVYTFLTENINLLQRNRGQRADRSCTSSLLFHAFSLMKRIIIICRDILFDEFGAEIEHTLRSNIPGLVEGDTHSFEDIVQNFWRCGMHDMI